MSRISGLCLMLLAAVLTAAGCSPAPEPSADPGVVRPADLPREAVDVLASIKRGGPFAFRKDGSIFGNFEKRLPIRERGYYREYTVPTPGARDRGARRIVAGRQREYYYTDDHYRTFRRIRE